MQKLIIATLFIIYAGGILTGAIREIKTPDAAEMYNYLERGIAEYDTASASGVKNAVRDNLKIFLLLVCGSIFKPLFWLVGMAVLVKGYLTGFSIMAALRLYGIRGLYICIPNLISAAVLIPSAIYYGGLNVSGLFDKYDKGGFYKRFLWATIFLAAIFCADAFIKGAGTPIFVKWATKLLKSA